MKKITITIIIILCLSSIIYIKTIQNNSKNINYAVEYNLTKNIFSKNKLCKINKLTIVFSDSTIAVVEISGIDKKAPYKPIELKMFLEKNNKGFWKVKKTYSLTE